MATRKSAFQRGEARAPDSEINVTPLIDIVLVMLIIFMVAVPIKIDEIAANLPKETQVVEPEEMPEDQLVVMGWEDGNIGLNKIPMERDKIYEELRIRLKFKKSRVVFVDAHPEVKVGTIVLLMDIAREAGAERVAMARLKPEGPRQYTAEELQQMEFLSAQQLMELREQKKALEGQEGAPAPL
ncbi:MAG: biopolymer transporter ExbD [Pseudomonadota bacterium]